MKLCASYNVFDGEELLEWSIRSVRESVEHINLLYQVRSNSGAEASPGLEDLVHDLKARGLVDEVARYEPALDRKPGWNHRKKRNLGLRLAKKRRCTHFMTMDVDEFYDRSQFDACKRFVEEKKVTHSACRFVNYIQKPQYRLEGYSFYFVPFIFRIGLFSRLGGGYFPVLVDPTRRLRNPLELRPRFRYFHEDELVMHHMTLVRKDLGKKFANMAAKEYLSSDALSAVAAWEYPNPYYDPTQKRTFKVEQVQLPFEVHL